MRKNSFKRKFQESERNREILTRLDHEPKLMRSWASIRERSAKSAKAQGRSQGPRRFWLYRFRSSSWRLPWPWPQRSTRPGPTGPGWRKDSAVTSSCSARVGWWLRTARPGWHEKTKMTPCVTHTLTTFFTPWEIACWIKKNYHSMRPCFYESRCIGVTEDPKIKIFHIDPKIASPRWPFKLCRGLKIIG